MRLAKILLLISLLFTSNSEAQTTAKLVRYKGVNYLTLDAGRAYITGYQRPGQKYPVWVTAAHLFSERQIMWAELSRGNWFVDSLRYLGSDICQVYFGPDSVEVGGLVQFPKVENLVFTGLGFYPEPKKARWLLDKKEYKALGYVVFNAANQDSIQGVIVKVKSRPGDCGSGFIIDNVLCIVIRLLSRMVISNLPPEQVSQLDSCTLVVPVSFGK